MFDSARPYTFDRVVRMVLGVLALAGLFLLLRYLSDVLVPFAAAAALAYFLNPLVSEIERRMKRRGWAVAFTL
ncbi:MAG: AI-2E family transporter, partial [Phycisphaerae bacterium]